MGSRSGFDALLDLDELATVVDRGSGAVAVATRQANALKNLGILGSSGTLPTAGTAQANSIVVIGANKNLDTMEIDTLNVGASGVVGIINLFSTTASKGKTTFNSSDNTGNTTTAITVAAQGGARTYTVPDAGGSASFLMSAGNQTLTGALTLAAGQAGAGLGPLYMQSGTVLTSPVAGSVEYDGNGFYATSQASSRSLVDAEQYIIQATEPAADNNAGLDTAVAAAVFTAGAGTITLVAGKTYFFEGQYLLTNTGTTAHTWATLFGGTATFTALGTSYTVNGNSSGTANAAATGGLTGFLTGSSLSTGVVCTASSTSATEQVMVQVMGTIVVNAGGTLIPQMKASARPGASGTPGVTHKAGSFFRIWQAPTLGAIGNWS